ncbi:MAG: TauD/TfdA family dioxygenase [Proteobacteria bacterium]|nr:TauD/TfdA family dioxygenase [Pseudomonadota bacterium]
MTATTFDINAPITGPGAWVGPDIQDGEDWIYRLDQKYIDEIDAALGALKASGKKIPFDAENFPLPTFNGELLELLAEVADGRGVVMVRGLPRERYTDDECALIYWGIGRHLGNPISQNSRGHRLGHVTDEGKSYDDPTARGYQTRSRMDFHTDMLPVDVLGLFCLHGAKKGGASALVSSLSIHNVVREERPDLLPVLHAPFNLDWRDEMPDDVSPWYAIPKFSEQNGRVSARFCSRPYYESVVRHDPKLGLTDLQQEALDFVQDVANRPELRLTMTFEEGDIQLTSNLMIMHSREAYEDFDEPDRKRHLLRMWIAVDEARRRPVAPALDECYDWVRKGGFPTRAA